MSINEINASHMVELSKLMPEGTSTLNLFLTMGKIRDKKNHHWFNHTATVVSELSATHEQEVDLIKKAHHADLKKVAPEKKEALQELQEAHLSEVRKLHTQEQTRINEFEGHVLRAATANMLANPSADNNTFHIKWLNTKFNPTEVAEADQSENLLGTVIDTTVVEESTEPSSTIDYKNLPTSKFEAGKSRTYNHIAHVGEFTVDASITEQGKRALSVKGDGNRSYQQKGAIVLTVIQQAHASGFSTLNVEGCGNDALQEVAYLEARKLGYKHSEITGSKEFGKFLQDRGDLFAKQHHDVIFGADAATADKSTPKDHEIPESERSYDEFYEDQFQAVLEAGGNPEQVESTVLLYSDTTKNVVIDRLNNHYDANRLSMDFEGLAEIKQTVNQIKSTMEVMPIENSEYFQNVDRSKSESMLENEETGSYIIRPCSEAGHIAVSIKRDDKIEHLKINRSKYGNNSTSFLRRLKVMLPEANQIVNPIENTAFMMDFDIAEAHDVLKDQKSGTFLIRYPTEAERTPPDANTAPTSIMVSANIDGEIIDLNFQEDEVPNNAEDAINKITDHVQEFLSDKSSINIVKDDLASKLNEPKPSPKPNM